MGCMLLCATLATVMPTGVPSQLMHCWICMYVGVYALIPHSKPDLALGSICPFPSAELITSPLKMHSFRVQRIVPLSADSRQTAVPIIKCKSSTAQCWHTVHYTKMQ